MLLKIQEAMVKFKERYTTLPKALKEFRFYVEHRWLTYITRLVSMIAIDTESLKHAEVV